MVQSGQDGESPTVQTGGDVFQSLKVKEKGIDIQPRFSSMSKPLGYALPKGVRDKIKAGEFVRMYDVVYPDASRCMLKGFVDAEGELVFAQAASEKRLHNIDMWRKGMMTIASILTSDDPSLSPHLFRYIANIESLKEKGGDWEYYDQEFRKLRQKNECPWQFIDWELWNDALFLDKGSRFHKLPAKMRGQDRGRYRANFTNTSAGRNKFNRDMRPQIKIALNKIKDFQVPKGYCYLFLAGMQCNGCSFKHQCPSCRQVHSLFQCPSASKKGNSSVPKK